MRQTDKHAHHNTPLPSEGINQLINLSANQPTNQPINQQTYQSIGLLAG